MRNMHPFHRSLSVTLSLLTTLAVTGCGTDETQGSASSDTGITAEPSALSNTASGRIGVHNEADVTFAQSMIKRHEQAVAMATMGETQATDPKVKALATKIKTAQRREIDEMTYWLTDWGVPTTPLPPTGAHVPDMSDAGMPGMMSDENMRSLENAHGATFDTMFLDMMIDHHQGAIEMAITQQQQGRNDGARAFAANVQSDQTAEITQMRALLGKQ